MRDSFHLTFHVFTPHDSRITFHASRFTLHPPPCHHKYPTPDDNAKLDGWDTLSTTTGCACRKRRLSGCGQTRPRSSCCFSSILMCSHWDAALTVQISSRTKRRCRLNL